MYNKAVRASHSLKQSPTSSTLGQPIIRKQPTALPLIAQKRTVNVNSHIICVKKSASGTNISSEKLA